MTVLTFGYGAPAVTALFAAGNTGAALALSAEIAIMDYFATQGGSFLAATYAEHKQRTEN